MLQYLQCDGQRRFPVCLIIVLCCLAVGCDQGVRSVARTLAGDRTFHEKFNWRAEVYFDDPQVIALCQAIEANDLEEMERLIEAGADVNARGQGNMTPLMWAFPDNKLERFKLLLEHGSDPNVKITTDLGVPSAFRAEIRLPSVLQNSVLWLF